MAQTGTFFYEDEERDEDDGHDMLVKEIEKLKLEQGEKDREINKLRQHNKELNVKLSLSPQQPQV